MKFVFPATIRKVTYCISIGYIIDQGELRREISHIKDIARTVVPFQPAKEAPYTITENIPEDKKSIRCCEIAIINNIVNIFCMISIDISFITCVILCILLYPFLSVYKLSLVFSPCPIVSGCLCFYFVRGEEVSKAEDS